MSSTRPIFVVGCPRSGTTMLQLMLHAHRRIAVPPETRFLLAAYWRRRDFGDLSQVDNRHRLARWIVDRPQTRFQDLGLETLHLAGTRPGNGGRWSNEITMSSIDAAKLLTLINGRPKRSEQ